MYFAKAFIITQVKKALLAHEIEKEETKLFETVTFGSDKLKRSHWEELVRSVYSDMFDGMGLKNIQAHSVEGESFLSIVMENGDEISVHTFSSPRKAIIYINEVEVKTIMGSHAVGNLPRIVSDLYKAYSA